jgi:hypothetical protein
MRIDHFDYLCSSEYAQASLAEQYAGLPFEAAHTRRSAISE